MTNLPEYRLKWGKEKRLAGGHAWAFRNEIDFDGKDPGPGALVRILTHKGRPLGVGFLNSFSNLSFRLLAPHGEFGLEATAEEIVAARLAQAYALRGPRASGAARRLVFSEGDWLPGLVVDDYNGVFVAQIQTAGMEKRRSQVLEFLKALPGTKAVVERSEDAFRVKEGLAPSSGLLHTAAWDEDLLGRVPFTEHGLQFTADVLKGHKTGFFLDQAPARALAQSLAKGRRCLDLFCHSGGFAVAMAVGGATEVLAMDQSADALALAEGHARLNRVEDKVRYEKADLFTHLREMEKAGERFGLIVLDPPALAKDGEALGNALRGYRELNLRALRLLEPGGRLITCSCSGAVGEGQFSDTVQSAAADAPATVRELERFGAGADHPRLLGMPETRYLKAMLLHKA
ncbi:MAG TPA: class I SAM-dependent rRNA methyltransferase [bacterium]|nr:class I SAM-dependent rRNA methyltransferase [bacterium]